MDYKNINDILLKKIYCAHEERSGGIPRVYQCDIIIDLINEAIKNNVDINYDRLSSFISNLFSVSYTRELKCVITNKEKIKDLMNNIFNVMPKFFVKLYADRSYILEYMLRFPYYDTCYDNLNDSKLNNEPNVNNLLNKITQRLSSNYIVNNDILANFVIKNIDMTNDVIQFLVKSKSDILAQHIANIIDKSSETYTDKVLYNACLALPYSKPIIQSLVLKNLKITNEHLRSVILLRPADSIDFIFEISNVKATKEHFGILGGATIPQTTIVDKRDAIIVKKELVMLNRNYTIYKDGIEKSYSADKTEILIKHGFIPDEETINEAIQHNKEIYNVERFGIVLDEKFLKLCQTHSFYPKYDFKCIDSKLYGLQELCLTKNPPKIRQYLKKNKVKPDDVCMKNASKVANNKEIIELLVNAGGIITKDTVLAYVKISQDPQLKYLMLKYFENVDKV